MPDNPVPAYFSLRYILWLAWANAITVLSSIQGIFAAVLLAVDDNAKEPLLSHNALRLIILCNAILTGILAQIDRKSPPPTKSQPSPELPRS